MDTLSAYLAIAVFLAQLLFKICKKQSPDLQDLISIAFSAATLPTGGKLIYCALFRPEEALKISDIRIQIAICGVIVLFIGVSSVVKGFKVGKKQENI